MDLLSVLKKYDLKPDTLKGQHFLLDKSLIKREVEYANVTSNDVVLEIGSGPANLTQELAEHAKKVIAIEKSKVFVDVLNDMSLDNVEVIHDDASRVDFEALGFDLCVSNIPYQISATITEKLLKSKKLSVICYQKEFAHKMTIKPGVRQRSRLSVLVQYYSDPQILEEVPRGLFYPPPLVDSSLVKLTPKDVDEKDDLFWSVVKGCFMHKNQTVRNSLTHSSSFLGMSKEKLKALNGDIFEKKVYELTTDEFEQVTDYLRSF